MSGRRSKRKGYRVEAGLVKLLESWGLSAHRGDGHVGRDVIVTIDGANYRVECKGRGDGFKLLRRWLKGNDMLWLKPDYDDGLFVIPAGVLWSLLRDHAELFRVGDKLRLSDGTYTVTGLDRTDPATRVIERSEL